ncbi:MAG: NADH-quinone oxidoreductase subunit C, partial [Beijerinckiaceae bacterium]
MTEQLSMFGARCTAAIPGVTGHEINFGELTLHAEAAHIVGVVERLRNDSEGRFISLVDVCGVDHPARTKRFDVVYHFLSPHRNLRIRVKCQTDEHTPVPS